MNLNDKKAMSNVDFFLQRLGNHKKSMAVMLYCVAKTSKDKRQKAN